MNQAILHRGPDQSGFIRINLSSSIVYMGANRLAITAPDEHGSQPMSTADAGLHLCFNGEIYNHLSLRPNLRADFKTLTDTETLLYGLSKQGLSFISELDGMFAFICLDQSRSVLTLARDPKGMKPLYFYEDQDFFIASSEIRGILASGFVKKTFNEKALTHYLLFRYCKAPATFYQNIHELPSGSMLQWKPETPLNTQSIPTEPKPVFSTYDNIVNETDNLLQKAIQNQLPQYVNAGLLLSGGIDSSLLLAQLYSLGIKNFPVFSVVTSGRDKNHGTNDAYYAGKATRLYEAEQYVLTLDQSVINNFHEYVETIDQPVADAAGWLTWLISLQARQYVKTVFSGAGADEYFAGYNRHTAFHHYMKIAPVGTPLLNKLAVFPETRNIPLRKGFRLLNKLLESVDNTPLKTWNNFISFTKFKNGFVKKSVFRPEKEDLSFALYNALVHDRDNYLPYDVLKVTDNASMAAGLEVRLPYLDRQLTSYIQSIPADILLKNGSKWILKTLLKHKGGNILTQRPKEGFGIPLNKWLLSSSGKPLTSMLLNTDNLLYEYIDHAAVVQLLNDHSHMKKDYSGELYSLIVLSAWMKREFA